MTARNRSAASAWTDVKLAERRARRGGRLDGRTVLALALERGGFRRDPRARQAYSLPGQEGRARVDFGGDRSKSARLEEKSHGDWRGVSETIYFGYVRSEEDAEGWARYLHGLATGRSVPHPPIPQKKPPRPETVARRERERERTAGAGFYVVNATTGGARVSSDGRMYLPLAANHGPFRTLDEALPVAWEQYQQYLQMKFTYLLPVQVIESPSKTAAERGEGYVWWSDGRMHGAPVPEEQLRFANMARDGRSDATLLRVRRTLREGVDDAGMTVRDVVRHYVDNVRYDVESYRGRDPRVLAIQKILDEHGYEGQELTSPEWAYERINEIAFAGVRRRGDGG